MWWIVRWKIHGESKIDIPRDNVNLALGLVINYLINMIN